MKRAPGAVERWFGPAFSSLHPLLRELHEHGGLLQGAVEVSFGGGLGGIAGRHLALRLGVPTTPGRHELRVAIRSDERALHWDRQFNGSRWFRSIFVPVGAYPRGYFLERSGALTLKLGAAIVDGGWRWRHLGTRLGALPLPTALLGRTEASKQIVGGRYRFEVAIHMPGLGAVLQYCGSLTLAGK